MWRTIFVFYGTQIYVLIILKIIIMIIITIIIITKRNNFESKTFLLIFRYIEILYSHENFVFEGL